MTIRFMSKIGLAAAASCAGLIVYTTVDMDKKVPPSTTGDPMLPPTVEVDVHADRPVQQSVSPADILSIQIRLAALEQNAGSSDLSATDSLDMRIRQLEEEQRSLRQFIESQLFVSTASHETMLGDREAELGPTETYTDNAFEYEQRFWSETEDTEWARTIEAVIERMHGASELNDAYVDLVNCHQSACRVDFVHPQVDDTDDFIETIHASDLLEEEFYAESLVGADGHLRTRVYVARPGQQLFEQGQ